MQRTKELIQRRTTLSANLLMLFRYLRGYGFIVGPQEEALALRALVALDSFRDPERLRTCLRSVLCKTRGQQLAFNDLYDQFWKELERAVNSKIVEEEEEGGNQPKKSAGQTPAIQSIKDWLQGNTQTEKLETATYSADAGLMQQDFSLYSPDELREIWEIVQQLARTMARQLSRRWERTHRHHQLDLRRTVRQNLRRGGELLELAHKKPRRNRHRIVLLCDVSKSMELYSQFLIQFVYAFRQSYQHIEAFVFSTDLYRITTQLQMSDYQEAMQELREALPGWSGGTRIGQSFQSFTRDYRRLLNRQTTLLILSDGWDTGDEDTLARAMQRMQKRTAQVIWLNPLAGNPDFKPEVKGMRAAMPYVDVFASGHNLASLRELVGYLRRS